MAEVPTEIVEEALRLYAERFNGLIMNALVRHPATVELAEAAGMKETDAAIFIFMKMVPRMIESTPLLTNEGRHGLGTALIAEMNQVLLNTPKGEQSVH